MTRMLHRPEPYHLHHRGGTYTTMVFEVVLVVVMRRCRVMVFEKPEVIDKTDEALTGHTASHNAGMINNANVACMSGI